MLTIIAIAAVVMAAERLWRGGPQRSNWEIPQHVYVTNTDPIRVVADDSRAVSVQIVKPITIDAPLRVNVLNRSLDVAIPEGVSATIINRELPVRVIDRGINLR
jgi:hypothetical protein